MKIFVLIVTMVGYSQLRLWLNFYQLNLVQKIWFFVGKAYSISREIRFLVGKKKPKILSRRYDSLWVTASGEIVHQGFPPLVDEHQTSSAK